MGQPATLCKDFGVLLFIRVPWPAARITAVYLVGVELNAQFSPEINERRSLLIEDARVYPPLQLLEARFFFLNRLNNRQIPAFLDAWIKAPKDVCAAQSTR